MVLEGCKQLKPLVPLLKSINSNKSAVEFAFSLQETKHIRLSADSKNVFLHIHTRASGYVNKYTQLWCTLDVATIAEAFTSHY